MINISFWTWLKIIYWEIQYLYKTRNILVTDQEADLNVNIENKIIYTCLVKQCRLK